MPSVGPEKEITWLPLHQFETPLGRGAAIADGFDCTSYPLPVENPWRAENLFLWYLAR